MSTCTVIPKHTQYLQFEQTKTLPKCYNLFLAKSKYIKLMKAEDRSVCVFCSLGSRPFKVGEMEFQFLLGRSFGLKYWEFQRLKKAKYSVILEQHQFLATANPRGGKVRSKGGRSFEKQSVPKIMIQLNDLQAIKH